MDVIDRAAAFREIGRAERVHCGDGFTEGCTLGEDIPALAPSDQGDRIAAAVRGCQRRFRCLHPFGRIGPKKHAMDGLDRHGRAVQIHELNERIARGIDRRLLGRERLFLFQPAQTGCRQAVVAVGNGKAHGVCTVCADTGRAQARGKRIGLRARSTQTANVTAAGHEVKIIQRFVGSRQRVPEDRIIRITVKHHDVRHLQRRGRADAHTRGQTRGDRALRGADGRDRIRRVIIRLQIERADNAAAHGTARQRALHEHETVRHSAEYTAVEITMHGLLNLARCRTLIALAEVKLRQHQPQCGRCVTDGVLHRLPIAGIRRELVTGDDAPAPHIRMRRQ